MANPQDDRPESDLMQQVKDALDDGRRQPTKELGIPDHREETQGESDKRDGGGSISAMAPPARSDAANEIDPRSLSV
jgi:hypothetical protein